LDTNNLAIVKNLQRYKVFDVLDDKGNNALHRAALANNKKEVTLLLDAGVSAFAITSHKKVAFELATDPELREMLLHARFIEGVRYGCMILVTQVLEHGPKFNLHQR